MQQHADINCNTTTRAVCGKYGERVTPESLTIPMQAIGLSVLPSPGPDPVLLLAGERWLSAPHNNPQCPDECRTCTEPDTYIKGAPWVPCRARAC